MKRSPECDALVKAWEGYYTKVDSVFVKAYLDPVGVWTIGWGSIKSPDGQAVTRETRITHTEAARWLDHELDETENSVDRAIKAPVTQSMFDACVSLAYNIGVHGFAGSTVCRRINERKYAEAKEAFLLWVKGDTNGDGVLETIQGLLNRRKDEADEFDDEGLNPGEVTPPASTGRPYAPCPVPLPWGATYKRGEFGPPIYSIQCALIELEYLRKPANGEFVGDVFNEHVEWAVKTFQNTAFGLNHTDGIVGPKTRAAIEAALTKARAPKPPVENSVATLRCFENEWHKGAWIGLRRMILGFAGETFEVASGARGRQTFRRPQDPRSFPGNLEPIPQGRYRIGSIEFANGKDNYEGSFGAGLGPVWVSLDAEFSDDRGAFGCHLDSNLAVSPGSAGCVVFRDLSDLKRFVAALRKWNPKTLSVEWGL